MRILFVCTGNSFRSPVAESLLKKFRSDFVVESAEIEPASHIAENAKRFLKKENALGNLKSEPERIEQKDVEGYDLIIVMKERHKQSFLNVGQRPKTKFRFGISTTQFTFYLVQLKKSLRKSKAKF